MGILTGIEGRGGGAACSGVADAGVELGRGVGEPATKGKGLQLRLELGNVVTGEGERGESGSWRLDG